MGHSANFHGWYCLVVGFFSVVVFASESGWVVVDGLLVVVDGFGLL